MQRYDQSCGKVNIGDQGKGSIPLWKKGADLGGRKEIDKLPAGKNVAISWLRLSLEEDRKNQAELWEKLWGTPVGGKIRKCRDPGDQVSFVTRKGRNTWPTV